ncbi:C45 family peptidase [Leucobacter sp. wl10]|uniref:C45 family autoproteolytic acyltransferase/hydolase n=1 Tax=Leucobacter sp. wl10 TaxID=2304677 RepID=UPI000E5B66D4|nr:C45 family peptidase [Leucobacter sp. wl10]RGE20386.1 hypothetical protein D1J51_09410 [Leucobacter sp. wl10]
MTTHSEQHFDPDTMPPDVRPVIVISGSMREMGVQYGRQAREIIARNATVVRATILPMWNDDWAAMVDEMRRYERMVGEQNPGMLELWQGMAEGSGLDYLDVLIVNLSLPLLIMAPPERLETGRHSMCSTFSAWGSATVDGKLYASANLDQGWNAGTYTVVVVAFPDDGEPFISTPPWGGEIVGSLNMNAAGLVVMGSGGQSARPEDYAVAVPNMTSKLTALMHARTADEAVASYLSVQSSNAENAHFADPSTAKLVEYTPAHHAVRGAGDHGERDYLVATNHFLDEEMQSSLEPEDGDGYRDGWYDAWPRYSSYDRLLSEQHGELTLDRIAAVLGSHDYWDGEAWQRDVYSLEPEADPRSCWSPEMRGPQWKTLMKTIAIPEDRTVYLMNGESDRRMSTLPDAPGEYCRLVLGSSLEAIAASAVEDAKTDIWETGRDLNRADSVSPEQDELLNRAKRELWRGFNLQAVGKVSEDRDEALRLMGEALTGYLRAQTYARRARA